jgi:hypothetical protein
MAQEGAIKKLGRGKYVALDSDKQQMVGGGAPSSANQPTSPLITQPGLEDAAGPTDEDIEDALNQWGDGTGDGDDNQGGKTDGN